jgi:uncharacterized protein
MTKPVRVVIDTNILVSAFLWYGKPSRLLELAEEGSVRIFSSRHLMNELANSLAKEKLARAVLATGLSAKEMVTAYRQLTRAVRPVPVSSISRDPDDDHVIACAIAAKADFIVTGDRDLLVLDPLDGIRIVEVARFLELLDS